MNPRLATHRLFRATLLVSVLLLAQSVLTFHHTNLAAHATGVCEFCLTHADLTDGSTFVSLPLAVTPAVSHRPAFFPAAFATPHHPSYSARAPPLSYR